MKDQELVNALREHAEWQRGNEWETPITLDDDLMEAADRIRSMTDNELIGLLCKFRSDAEMKHIAGISTMPGTWKEIKKWLETPWEGKP